MKKSIIIFSAVFFVFFSCASKPEPQLESEMTASENKEAVMEETSEPITEPEVLEDKADSLEEIDEPDVTELPPEEEIIEEEPVSDDEIEDVQDIDNEVSPEDSTNNEQNQSQEDSNLFSEAETSNLSSETEYNKTVTDKALSESNSSDTSSAENTDEDSASDEESEDIDSEADEENTEDVQEFPVSRSVSLKVSEYLDISYPGNGWIYMGATDNSKNLTYFGRKLGTQNTNFSLQARIPGTKILHFYKNDNLTNQIIDDYIEVKVLEERGSNQTHIEAPEYKMPVKAKRPVVKTAVQPEETPEINYEDNSDGVESVESVTPAKKSQVSKPKTQKQETTQKAAEEKTETKTETKTEALEETQKETSTVSDSDLKNLLAAAKDKFNQKDYNGALAAVNQYLSKSKDNRDEALFVQGQIFETKSEVQDISKAIDSYTTLTKNYPASKFWDKANKRIIYLKRFYLQGR